jgi:hypothetical protein
MKTIQHPETVVARHREQQQVLSTLEAMLDGDITDAQYHVNEWVKAYRLLQSLLKAEADKAAETTPVEDECRKLRALLAEMYDHFQYSRDMPEGLARRVGESVRHLDKTN